MSLTPGSRLGPYEIVGPLGAGGMGEVFRARDTRLNRDVAIKILPSAVASDPERRARFEREAQLLASLNHPHIAAIHGIEEAGALTALILEFVDGVTLDGRIGLAGMPIEDALPIARQLIDALEAAHERGIVHRDLKPANIKVRPDGTVKVLDFGLAKALDANASSATAGSASISPTLTSPMTMVGTILGTAAYMSPEQAKGRAVDTRSDIWAFGAVFYEMLTGRRAFPGEDVTDTIVAVMSKEPDWAKLPPSTPPGVVRLLHRCLKKDPRERLRDIGDARFELTETSVCAPVAQAQVAAGPRAVEWTAAAVVGAAIAIAALWPRLQQPPAPPEVRMEIGVPADEQVASLAVSRDGRTVAFVMIKGGRSTLWTRSMGGGERRQVEGADGAEYPFWSPDGGSLGFFQEQRLKTIAAAGGNALTLCDAPTGRGGSWNTDGTILFTPINSGPIYSVSATGGPCSQLTTLEAAAGVTGHRFASWLPDGQHFLYTAYGEATSDVYVSSRNGPATRVLTNASNTTYVDSGYLLFVRGGTLTAQRFDLRTLRTAGDPVRVTAENPFYATGTRFGLFAAASNTVVWVPDTTPRSRLLFVDRSGHQTANVAGPDFFWGLSLSRDGSRAAVIRGPSGNANIWMFERRSGQLTRLTSRTGAYNTVGLSADGKKVAFSFNSGAGFNMFVRPADGSGEDREILHNTAWQHPGDWSADGRLLVYEVADPKNVVDIWSAPVDESAPPSPFLQSPFSETGPRLSPDGKWLAYTSDETGTPEVYVRAFPSGGEKHKVSTARGAMARWSQNGRELFFGNRTSVFVVAIHPLAAGIEIGAPTTLFERPFRQFDVSGSGAEFLLNALEPAPPSRIVVSVGWSPSGRPGQP